MNKDKKINKILKYLSSDKWYHGTDSNKYENIKKNGIKVDYNIGNELDFGYGFYLTNTKEQAADFINNSMKYSNQSLMNFSWLNNLNEAIPVVIEFDFTPLTLYEKNIYNFKFLNAYDKEFAEFVFHNRLYNIYGESHHSYDIIFGVMSDSLPTILLQKYKNGVINKDKVLSDLQKSTRVKQLSIHNQEICDILKISKVFKAIDGKEIINHDKSK